MLQGSDLVFGYTATPVLRGVSIDVPAGGLVGLIGPNGSGKTTLLRLLAGTRRPASGRVMLDGVPLASRSRGALARRLAVVPQETHLAFDYSVLEIVLMGRYAHLGPFTVEGPRDISIARSALAATGADSLESRLFSTLSGGEKQRVVIAAALAQITTDHPHNVGLLLDEPTAALDLKYQLGITALLRRLHAERRLTIVISTHDLGFAAGLCASIVMLKNGRVIAAGPTDEVLTPARILELYDVEAEIVRHPGTGRLNVVPVRVVEPGRHP